MEHPTTTNVPTLTTTFAQYTVQVRITNTVFRRVTLWANCGLAAASRIAQTEGWLKIRKVFDSQGRVVWPINENHTDGRK